MTYAEESDIAPEDKKSKIKQIRCAVAIIISCDWRYRINMSRLLSGAACPARIYIPAPSLDSNRESCAVTEL